MSNFEELDLTPELVEALAASGLETPTQLQRDLIPVVRRGNNVVAVAGPGSGVMAAYAVPLLQRIEPEGDRPRILVLTPTRDRAEGLADSLGRIAQTTGHRVSALAPVWVMPDRAQVLVGTPEGVEAARSGGRLSLEDVEAVVLDGANAMATAGSLDAVELVLDGIKADAQRVIVALPLTESVSAFADKHAKRSVHVPPVAQDSAPESPQQRGTLTVLEVADDRDDAAVAAVAAGLSEARHVVAFLRTEDAAADLGDELLVRGYVSGRPGDADTPVWLAVDALETRRALDESGEDDIVVLSVDVPGDADALDQRHGGGRGGQVLALSREVPHVKAAAREAGYELEMASLPEAGAEVSGLAALMAQIEEGIATQDTEAYRLLLEPLFRKHGAGAVAGAAVALLRDRRPARAVAPVPGGAGADAAAPQSFVRLFVSVGKVDGVNPGDLVGAITGEASVDAKQVGKIDLRDTFALVEVEGAIAEKVIQSLNGVSIRGRAARVDYHREDRRAPSGPRGGRGGPGGHRGGGPGRSSGPGRGGPGRGGPGRGGPSRGGSRGPGGGPGRGGRSDGPGGRPRRD